MKGKEKGEEKDPKNKKKFYCSFHGWKIPMSLSSASLSRISKKLVEKKMVPENDQKFHAGKFCKELNMIAKKSSKK